MTNLEAIREDLQPYPVRTTLIERQCIKNTLNPESDFSDEKKIAICVIEILSQMLTLNSVGEGGVSISFNKDEVKALIRRKCKEAGLDASDYISQPTVTRIE